MIVVIVLMGIVIAAEAVGLVVLWRRNRSLRARLELIAMMRPLLVLDLPRLPSLPVVEFTLPTLPVDDKEKPN